MSNPRTPGCDSEENEFAKQGGITNGAAWSVFSFFSFFFLWFFFLCSLRPASINQCNCDCNGASSGFSFFLLSLDFHWPQNEDPCRISFSFQFYLQKSKWQWMWSGTLSVGGCKTSTTSAPMTLRSPLSSVVTSTHQGRGEKERKPATCDIWYL